MPNYCYYSMCVKGKKESVEEFEKVISADYDYGTMQFSHDRHMFRVFEADTEGIEKLGKGVYQQVFNGSCAWSVHSCMFAGAHSYYESLKERYPHEFRGTTLLIESERLNLDIEVFAEETGMCFQEHYLIRNGELHIDECVDYYEYWVEEFETKEEAEEELEIEITDEEWNDNEGTIRRGGFGDWDFII